MAQMEDGSLGLGATVARIMASKRCSERAAMLELARALERGKLRPVGATPEKIAALAATLRAAAQ